MREVVRRVSSIGELTRIDTLRMKDGDIAEVQFHPETMPAVFVLSTSPGRPQGRYWPASPRGWWIRNERL